MSDDTSEDSDDADENFDIAELALLQFIYQVLILEINVCAQLAQSLLALHVRDQRPMICSLPVRQLRPATWEAFSTRLSDRIFRKMFRMSRISFQHLCTHIEAAVGKTVFRSEQATFLDDSQNQAFLDSVPGWKGNAKCWWHARWQAQASHLSTAFGWRLLH